MILNAMYSANNLACTREQRKLFTGVSFALQAGEVMFVEGHNGAGKSSLLRILTGLATPESGDVNWLGKSIHEHATEFLNALHYIGHTNGIKLALTVNENLALLEKQSKEVSVASCFDGILSQLHLIDYKHTLAKHLSAGQRRRIALAKLLLFPKQLWILDEPLTSLDADTQTIFLRALDQHAKEGGIVIASSHQPMQISAPHKTLRLSLC
jgi:heme exporter protein A